MVRVCLIPNSANMSTKSRPTNSLPLSLIILDGILGKKGNICSFIAVETTAECLDFNGTADMNLLLWSTMTRQHEFPLLVVGNATRSTATSSKGEDVEIFSVGGWTVEATLTFWHGKQDRDTSAATLATLGCQTCSVIIDNNFCRPGCAILWWTTSANSTKNGNGMTQTGALEPWYITKPSRTINEDAYRRKRVNDLGQEETISLFSIRRRKEEMTLSLYCNCFKSSESTREVITGEQSDDSP